jgi:predicted RNA methylase
MVTEQRSSVANENIQEVLDEDHAAGLAAGKCEQYFTPDWLAKECQKNLPTQSPASIFDPQCGAGALLMLDSFDRILRLGVELDNRIERISGVRLLHVGCQKFFEMVDDVHPKLRFVCVNANPPFGRKWKQADGKLMDSTLATWNFITAHGCHGYFISNRKTIESLRIDKSPSVYDYRTKKISEVWSNMRDGELGIVFWKHIDQSQFTPQYEILSIWDDLTKIVEDEKSLRPKFNIYLDHSGILKTYLSVRSGIKLKIGWAEVQKLAKIDNSRPLALVTEVETRRLLKSFIDAGIYSIEPAARVAMQEALDDVVKISCPIMPCTDFEHVAYVDDLDMITCIQDEVGKINLTKGKSYPLRTFTYRFNQNFKRNKVHFNEEEGKTYISEHECSLSGQDRCIAIRDDSGNEIKFMDKPDPKHEEEHEEALLWKYFQKPEIKTVADTLLAKVEQNTAVLKALEMTAGYEYYPGQREYLSRIAVKDHALVAGCVGTGKSLMAISLIAAKSPKRALIIAPQGSIRGSPVESDEEEGDESEMDASQWQQELTRFAPYLQVFEIFSYDDYKRICSVNGGELPEGAAYITYYEAFFTNGARERVSHTWDDLKLNEWAKSVGFQELPVVKDAEGRMLDRRFNCDTIGREEDGIRCILEPSLSTLIGDKFDCVLADEAQKAAKLTSFLTQMLIRLQPKYRFALTATPIPNTVSDIFPLIGWLAVPDWYKGRRLNAAFPYTREDLHLFNSTFLSTERDMTQEDLNRRKDPKWRGTCVKESPIISSPARLLKILKPTMGYISKPQCSKSYVPPVIKDVRVNMGKEQAVLYGHFLKRENIPASNPLVRARKQVANLRAICADPAGFKYGGPKVNSNMNPKVLAILELTRDILAAGENVVIVNSRVGLTSTLHDKLIEAGVAVSRIDSTMSAAQHSHQSNLFKLGKTNVHLLGIKCAAAYSYDGCMNLIVGSLEYSHGPFAQAIGRIDRLTSTRAKNIWCILNRNSIEEVQFEVVSLKGDAATICLQGKRVPRDFKPVDGTEVLAAAIERFDLSGATPEPDCERKWPALRDRLEQALTQGKK